MKCYEKVRSTVQPEKLKIDEYSVWIAENIIVVTEETEVQYEYDLTQYNKDEYIQMIAEKNTILAEKLTDTQIALTEIYEGMVTA